MKTIKESWSTIETWMKINIPEIFEALNPPASEANITELEKLIGQPLPEDYKELYRIHDGEGEIVGAFIATPFSSLERVKINYKNWFDLFHEEGIQEAVSPLCESHPEGAIQKTYIDLGWIAFTEDGGGNHLGVDLNPGPNGTYGQVINFGRDQEQKYVLAKSLSEFLAWFAARIEDGSIRAANAYGSGVVMCFDDPQQQGTLRLLPKLLGYE
jgi:cell wall assembly regulator SMI1